MWIWTGTRDKMVNEKDRSWLRLAHIISTKCSWKNEAKKAGKKNPLSTKRYLFCGKRYIFMGMYIFEISNQVSSTKKTHKTSWMMWTSSSARTRGKKKPNRNSLFAMLSKGNKRRRLVKTLCDILPNVYIFISQGFWNSQPSQAKPKDANLTWRQCPMITFLFHIFLLSLLLFLSFLHPEDELRMDGWRRIVSFPSSNYSRNSSW